MPSPWNTSPSPWASNVTSRANDRSIFARRAHPIVEAVIISPVPAPHLEADQPRVRCRQLAAFPSRQQAKSTRQGVRQSSPPAGGIGRSLGTRRPALPGALSETVRAFYGVLEQYKVDDLVARSEEHTSELQSHVNLVCRLLLEKKNILGTLASTG